MRHLRGANVSHYLAIVGGWKCIWLQGLQEGEVKQGRNVFLSPAQLSVLNSSFAPGQSRKKCCSEAATLRVKQGP